MKELGVRCPAGLYKLPDGHDLILHVRAKHVKLWLEPRTVIHHCQHVHALRVTFQLHSSINEFVNVDLIAAIPVKQRKYRQYLRWIDLQAREVRTDPRGLHMLPKLLEAHGPRSISVRGLEDLLDLQGSSPQFLSKVVHDLILRASADSTVNKYTGHHIQHANEAKGDVKCKEYEVTLSNAILPQRVCVHHPIIATSDGGEQRDHRLMKCAVVAANVFGMCADIFRMGVERLLS
mmetsp:Transcript_11865/g.27024  ORF Transcript_11865/g.27024 Transcript_11865/m.27024 type:complete len:234 (-) Transcript_11865:1727-2428(-)